MSMLNYAKYFEEEKKEIEIKGRLEGKLEGIREGMREGKLEGIREGKLEGKREGMKEIILKLSGKNMTAEQIADLLDLDINDVEAIISDNSKDSTQII